MIQTLSNVQLIFMPLNFQTFSRKGLLKVLAKYPTGSINVQLAANYLLHTFKLKNEWQQQHYPLSVNEEAIISQLNLSRLLVPYSSTEYPASYLLLEDETQYMFKLDSFIDILCSRIKDNTSLYKLRVFLIENSGLRGFSVVNKEYCNCISIEN